MLLLVLIALAAAVLPFVNYAPNRLVSGESRQLWQIWQFPPALLLIAPLLLAGLSLIPGRLALTFTLLVAQLLFIALFWSGGKAATWLAQSGSPLARTSPGSGLWLWLAVTLLICSDAIRRLAARSLWRWLLNAQIWILPVALLWSG